MDIERCLEKGPVDGKYVFVENYNPEDYAPVSRSLTKIEATEGSKNLQRSQTYSSKSDAELIKDIQKYINHLYETSEPPIGLVNRVVDKYNKIKGSRTGNMNTLFIYPITDYYVRLSYGKNVCLRDINTRFKTDYDSQIRTEFLKTLTKDEKIEYDELTAGQTSECTIQRRRSIDPSKLARSLKSQKNKFTY
jgi:hypothetical protein